MPRIKLSDVCVICGGPYRSKGLCRKHYRQFSGESKRRYQDVKADPVKFKKTKDAIQRYRTSEEYKESRKEHDRKYYNTHHEEILYDNMIRNEKHRFGMLREVILTRDHHKCTKCGNEDMLVIHHVNGQGRNTNTPDNRIENLTTLCKSCHMKIHSPNSTPTI